MSLERRSHWFYERSIGVKPVAFPHCGQRFGKVRALAKGGRRLKSSFENALDLLTHCNIVLLRKTSGSLDLLTEAQVLHGFSGLRKI